MSLSYINRRGVSALRHYFSGKAISIALTLSYLFIVTRNLTIADYADYVTAIAIAEIYIGATAFGLDWLAAIKIPEALASSKLGYARLVRNLLGLKIISQLAFFALTMLLAQLVSAITEIGLPLQLGIGYAIVEGIHRYVATSIFDPALLQISSKRMWVAKTSFQFGAISLIWLVFPNWLCATSAILTEAAGSLVGLIVARRVLADMLTTAPHAINSRLWRLLALPCIINRQLVSTSYFASLLSWATSISAFVVIARILGGEETAAIIGFCATLTSQLRRYLPTEMFLGVVRAFIYARFAIHASNQLLANDLRHFFALGISAVALILTLFSSFGTHIIYALTNGKYLSAINLLLISIFGLVGVVGRRTTETAANALSATCSWATISAFSLVSLPLACSLFLISDNPLSFVTGWIAADVITFIGLDLHLRRLRGVATISAKDGLKFLALSPIYFVGYWAANQEFSLLSHLAIMSALLAFVTLVIFQSGLINYKMFREIATQGQV